MDVTCERCSTAYEFDDALVSERGTTVKCTSCGHQFKVRRPQPVGAPERWLVRTIDGRELEFRALRELQAAIAQASITRDDVLSRGGSRPRRLGSIAELEPFFVSAGAGGTARATSLGLGPRGAAAGGTGLGPGRPRPAAPSAPSRGEVSVAIPLPRGPADLEGGFSLRGEHEALKAADASTAPHGGSASAPLPSPPAPPGFGSPRPASVPPPPVHRSRAPGSIPPPAGITGAPLPGVVIAPLGAPPLPSAVGFDDDDETTRAEARDESAPDLAALARTASIIDTSSALADQILPPARGPIDSWPLERPLVAMGDTPRPPSPLAKESAPPPPRPPPKSVPPPRQAARGAAQISPMGETFGPPLRADQAPVAPLFVPPPPADLEEWPIQDQHTASVPPLTPTPAAVRSAYDEELNEPRFSHVATPRSGAVRWIAAVVVIGMASLAAITVGRKYLSPASPAPATTSDARLTSLLADGEKSLADGDLESAKEQFDKASMLGERDPRAAADLARLATTRADVDWLRQRLLPPDDAEQATARRELDQAASRARKAADHAAEVASADASVTRSRIDALRVSGDVPGARKLVSAIAAASSQPDNALALAELDLCDPKPEWPTVLGRLRSALTTDGNLGRARSMLVYALARSGDLSGARAELDRLAALPRPHPLVGTLQAFVKRSTAAADASATPDASAKPATARPSSAASGPREPRPAPPPVEPRQAPPPPPPPPQPARAPEEPPPSGPVDTSDLPGIKAPPAPPPPTHAPAAPPAPTGSPSPPAVDTSDLPGMK